MKENQEVTEEKKLKTWDEAVSELRAFIIQSKKEEAEKQKEQREQKEKSEQ